MDRALAQAEPVAEQLRPYLQGDVTDGAVGQGDGAEPPAGSGQAGEVPDGVVPTRVEGSSQDEAMGKALEQAEPAAEQLRPFLQENQDNAADGAVDQDEGAGPLTGTGQVGEVPDGSVPAESAADALEGQELLQPETETPEGQQLTQSEGRPQDEAVRRAQAQAGPVGEQLQAYLKENAAGSGSGDPDDPSDPDDSDDSDDPGGGGSGSGDPRISRVLTKGIPGQNTADQETDQRDAEQDDLGQIIPGPTPGGVAGRQRHGRGR